MKIMMLQSFFGGVGWWRFESPAAALRAAGHEVFCPDADRVQMDLSNRGANFYDWLMHHMPNHDIVHAGFSAHPYFGISLFKARDVTGVPVVTDIDDDIDAVPAYNKAWSTFHPGAAGQRVAKTQLRYSDGVTFSTEPLAKALGYLHPNHTVLGNYIDVDAWDYPAQPGRDDDKSIRLMVTGGSQRYGDWQIFEEPLKAAMEKYDGTDGKPMLRLFFLGATPDWVEAYFPSKLDPKANRVFYIAPAAPVSLFCKAMRYVRPDIVISPTQTNKFNASKSGLKYLESALAGAAFLCTDWPTYDNAPKGTCLKVDNSPVQWKESLAALIEDQALRQRLAETARDHVLAHCTTEQHILPRISFYQKVIEEARLARSNPPILVGQPNQHPEPASPQGSG